MLLCKIRYDQGKISLGLMVGDGVQLIELPPGPSATALTGILHSPDPLSLLNSLPRGKHLPIAQVEFLPPLDEQEVWAAGVTYKRSREARERESVGAARFYDLVYSAARPELFFKATPARVVGSGSAVRIRRDSRWSVPEPELAVVLTPELKIAGFTIGNDMSARDIEGENPLYLPQAKVYDACCALGPAIGIGSALPPLDQVSIELLIERAGKEAFRGSTTLASMARSFADLISWLGKEAHFPNGVILLTGTGIVPPDHFSLAAGDRVHISITGLGTLSNSVAQGE